MDATLDTALIASQVALNKTLQAKAAAEAELATAHATLLRAQVREIDARLAAAAA
jgi:hypothetical protein